MILPFALALLTIALAPPPAPVIDTEDDPGDKPPDPPVTDALEGAAELAVELSAEVSPEPSAELPETPSEPPPPQTVWESRALRIESQASTLRLFIDVHGEDVVVELETSPNGECWLPAMPKRRTGSPTLVKVEQLLGLVRARVTYDKPPAPEGHICVLLVADQPLVAA